MRRRANRILMAIVLILLCLVLITTSVVSGIFAKYTVQKHILLTLGFESFGIKVEVFASEAIKEQVGTGYKDNQGTITVENLMLNPGDEYLDAITFKVTGKPTTDAKITINVNVEPLSEAFNVDAESFPNLDYTIAKDKTQTYVPMKFYVNNTIAAGNYNSYSAGNVAATLIGSKIEGKLKDTSAYLPNDGGGVYKRLIARENVEDIQTFGFGWERDANSKNQGACFDEIGTWISYKEPTFTITYTITVEQIENAN